MSLKTLFSVGPGAFTDEEFARAMEEIVTPDLEGWELFVESMGIKIYRKYKEESGLYEYKTLGVMADLNPEMCAQVYVDWEYRKVWDSYVLALHPIKDASTGLEGLYWCVDYPWPMSDRDVSEIPTLNHCCIQYTFVRDFKIVELDGVRTYAVLAKSHPFPDQSEKSGVIRVDSFQQSCIMQSDGKDGAKAFMHYYDNPKGMIPAWLINWAAKTGVPQFLDMMRKAVFGYPDFLEARRQELGLEKMDNAERMRKLYGLEASDIPEIPEH